MKSVNYSFSFPTSVESCSLHGHLGNMWLTPQCSVHGEHLMHLATVIPHLYLHEILEVF